MSLGRLENVRDLMKRRRRDADRARRAHEVLKAHLLNERGNTFRKLTARCDLPHKRGGWPKLAEISETAAGFLLISRIAWLPSDQLKLRPWLREHLEGAGLDQVTYDLAMTDDVFLSDMLRRHDAWADALESTGHRWLRSTPPHEIVALVEPDRARQAIGLWVRCKDHPGCPESLSGKDLFEAARFDPPAGWFAL